MLQCNIKLSMLLKNGNFPMLRCIINDQSGSEERRLALFYSSRAAGSLVRMAPMSTELEAKRTRLAALERELSQLGARHDIAMSAFRFDEAGNLQRRIGVLERERAELVTVLPAAAPPPPAVPVPVRVQSRPVPRRRRG